MNEFICGDCWRRENLSFVQRLDPAFNRRGQRFLYLCAQHQAERNEANGGAPDRKAA
ncbi:hypothetical protein [Nocardia jejuensis]|uniref:hypothetical protein n=1 Tax=Nocardia jejuensis TaxID=328049 RepID=UPI000B16C26C|nr:hypothetical protein [Nocardia jejuensis]